jgi:hypothetical protein
MPDWAAYVLLGVWVVAALVGVVVGVAYVLVALDARER